MSEYVNHKLRIQLEKLPPWTMEKVERLDFIVNTLAKIGPGDIKTFPEEKINEIKRYVMEAQSLHGYLVDEGNIIRLVGQQPMWVALDKQTVQEVNDKLMMIRELWTGGAEVKVSGEVEDVSVPHPDDDFSDEEEEESFW